jgi:hypothetical protein
MDEPTLCLDKEIMGMARGRLRRVCFSFALLSAYPALDLRAQSAPPVLVGAADIARCGRAQAEATAKLLDKIEGTVFTAGDHAYPNGTPTEFLTCYDPTWGRHRKRTRPSPGNHDYDMPDAAPYFEYFGASAGPAGRGYYSYNLGAWHIIALNSNPGASSWGAAQENWLIEDLKANPAICTLAYWHHPRFSSGERYGNHPHVANLFKILYDHGADVIIAGHDHIYERFAPQNPAGKADPLGIRQFIAGTGGARLYRIGTIKANSEIRNTAAHGVLKLTLHSTSYDWEFIAIRGQKFRDSGAAQCSLKTHPSNH